MMRGFAPRRRGPFVSAKGPKTILARARPLRSCSETGSPGSLRLRTESRWLRNSLRSNSLRREFDSVLQLRRVRRREETQEANFVFKLMRGKSYKNSILLTDLTLSRIAATSVARSSPSPDINVPVTVPKAC